MKQFRENQNICNCIQLLDIMNLKQGVTVLRALKQVGNHVMLYHALLIF